MVIIVGYGDETRNLMVKYNRMACECVSRNVRFTWNIRASNERENRKVLIFLVLVGPQGFLENYRELKPNRLYAFRAMKCSTPKVVAVPLIMDFFLGVDCSFGC